MAHLNWIWKTDQIIQMYAHLMASRYAFKQGTAMENLLENGIGKQMDAPKSKRLLPTFWFCYCVAHEIEQGCSNHPYVQYCPEIT